MTAKKAPARKAPAKKAPAKKAPAKPPVKKAAPKPKPMDLHERTERLVAKSVTELEEMVESGTPETKLSAISKLMPLINQAYNAREETDELEEMRTEFGNLMGDIREFLAVQAVEDVEVDTRMGPTVEIETDEHTAA